MSGGILGTRELCRATLARQMLLERQSCTVPQAVSRLAGLQAQMPNPPYIGLWTRLEHFHREDLTHLMEQRHIVRAVMMRSTLHLVTAEDHWCFRSTLQPAFTRALRAFFGKRAKDLDVEKLIEAARPSVEEKARSTGEIRDLLSEVEPEGDPEAMAYALRTYLPLVQVPPAGTWGSGSWAAYTTAESWLGEPPRTEQTETTEDLGYLLYRYLAAFGPATIMDFQAWSGVTGLRKAIEELKRDLFTFVDEEGRELLDLPGAPLPPPETPAPVRFVPEYDNLLLSHADRRRIIADEHRKKVFLSAARVRATFLVDGFVAGTWRVEKSHNKAMLVIEPFGELSMADRSALQEEGQRLVQFVAEPNDTGAHEVRFAPGD